MSIKKIFITFLFSFSIMTSAFAGKEDWNGTYTVKDSSGNSNNIVRHTPTGVSYLFFNAGECLRLAKGSKINGVVIKEDVNLCRKMKVITFENEVLKLGRITDRSVKLGPTYME